MVKRQIFIVFLKIYSQNILPCIVNVIRINHIHCNLVQYKEDIYNILYASKLKVDDCKRLNIDLINIFTSLNLFYIFEMFRTKNAKSFLWWCFKRVGSTANPSDLRRQSVGRMVVMRRWLWKAENSPVPQNLDTVVHGETQFYTFFYYYSKSNC